MDYSRMQLERPDILGGLKRNLGVTIDHSQVSESRKENDKPSFPNGKMKGGTESLYDGVVVVGQSKL